MGKEQPLWSSPDIGQIARDIERTLYYGMRGITVGADELEKHRMAMCKLFVPEFDSHGIPAFESFRESYERLTGDTEITGFFYPQKVSKGLRACMDFHSGSFNYVLQNAINMHLSKSYRAFPYHEEIFVSERKEAKDFRAIHSIQAGYLEDLPTLDPEVEDYQNLTPYGDTESEYRIGQKGGILWVTRKFIVNDSVDFIKDMIARMARAARKAHARAVWSFYLNNSDCPDGTAWFTSGHENLGSNALEFTSLITAITALANMTEPEPSGEKLGLDLESFDWHLVVPVALWETAVKKNQASSYYTSNDLTTKTPNAAYRLFGAANERVIVCPFESDTNDWGVVRNPGDVGMVEMSYLQGREEPEFILHQGGTDEMVFKQDRMGYKIRHEYGGTLVDYRGAYKSVVS
jgi:hypothetical protein